MKTNVFLILLIIFNSKASATEQYLCAADKSSGFSFNKSTKEWTHTTFKANSKYVISESDNKNSAFVIREIGDSMIIAWCKDSFNEANFLFCDGLGGSFKLNRVNGRYISANLIGYVNVVPSANKITDETSDTPYIEIGKCSRF